MEKGLEIFRLFFLSQVNAKTVLADLRDCSFLNRFLHRQSCRISSGYRLRRAIAEERQEKIRAEEIPRKLRKSH
jgi:hypothetical protein